MGILCDDIAQFYMSLCGGRVQGKEGGANLTSSCEINVCAFGAANRGGER